MPEPQSVKAFEFAADVSKQLITLSTGVITLTLALARAFSKSDSRVAKQCLFGAWMLFVASITGGLATLSALTSHVGAIGQSTITDQCLGSINCPNIRFFAIVQWCLFLLGISLTLVYGALVLRSSKDGR